MALDTRCTGSVLQAVLPNKLTIRVLLLLHFGQDTRGGSEKSAVLSGSLTGGAMP